MSEVLAGRNLDAVLYVATRIAALAIAITSLGIVVARSQHEATAKAQAIAAHKAILAAHTRKPPPQLPPPPYHDGILRSYMSGSKSGFGGLGRKDLFRLEHSE